jgi:thiamine biosynthesis lipoprotein
MGMPVRVALYAPDRDTAERAGRAAFARIAALDARLSDYRPDSEVSRLPESRGWVSVSPDLFSVLSTALEVSRASDGAFDPTIGPLTTLWREARRTRALPAATALENARQYVSWRFIELDDSRRTVRLTRPGMRLDLGGIAKGYILQEALAVLVVRGAPAALLEAGGDIVAGDAPPGLTGWHIDVPYGDSAFQARARRLVRAALATSGPTFQFVEIEGVRYSHVVDPRTGRALTSPRVAGVIARDGATADALATAFGVVDAAGAAELAAAFPDAIVSR